MPPSMRRRSVLAGAGAGLAALAGCGGGGGDGGGDDLIDDCGAVVGDGDVTGCFPGGGDLPVTVGRSVRDWVVTTGDSTVETVSIVVRNESGGPLTLADPAWRLLQRGGDGWTEVATGAEGPDTVSAGSDHTFTLSLSSPPYQTADRTSYRVLDVTDGAYAFVVRGSLSDPDRTVRVATAFTLTSRQARDGTVGL